MEGAHCLGEIKDERAAPGVVRSCATVGTGLGFVVGVRLSVGMWRMHLRVQNRNPHAHWRLVHLDV